MPARRAADRVGPGHIRVMLAVLFAGVGLVAASASPTAIARVAVDAGHEAAAMARSGDVSTEGTGDLAVAPKIVPGTDGRPLPAAPVVEPSITIAILPDRTTGRAWGIPYLVQAVEDLNLIGPDAIFTVGDMVQGYTRSLDQYTAEVDEFLSIVDNFEAPFFPLPGNHDVISGMRNPNDRRFEREYQKRFGPLYYAAYLDHVSVICLYTDEELDSVPKLSRTQVDWAVAQVEEAERRGNPLLVLMHKPVWRYRDSNWFETMHPTLARAAERGLKVLTIAGHFHSLQRDEDRDGVEYHLLGTCGGMIDQHPLGGQLQHFTIVKVTESGDTRVFHQPVGTTFPPDFVLAEDQNRVFRLKSQGSRFEIENVLDQPLGQWVTDTIRIRVQNPIDRPITLRGGLLLSEPEPSLVPGTAMVGRTEVDIFNPFVARIDTPFRQVNKDNGTLTLEPNERGVYEIPVSVPAQTTYIAPPQVHLIATFEDTKGRTVPVVIRRRVPLKTVYEVPVSASSTGATAEIAEEAWMPISAWDYSVYDLRERDPQVALRQVDEFVEVIVTTFDNNLAYEPVDAMPERLENPMSDTIVIRIGEAPNQTVYFVEPFSWKSAETVWQATATPAEARSGNARNRNDEMTWSVEKAEQVDARVMPMNPGYRVQVRIPKSVFGTAGSAIPFNVLVADNDETYHTQWRSWAQENAGSAIVLPAADE